MKNMLITVLLAGLFFLGGCSSSTTEEFEVNGHKIASFFKVIGQKDIKDTIVTYKEGTISEAEIIEYMNYLKKEEEFTMLPQETENNHRILQRLTKESEEQKTTVYVDILYLKETVGEVTIHYYTDVGDRIKPSK
ncbi:hypothetical protein ACYSNR_12945 [Enterococcus sp. LJL128]|uniref:hypothetical protein n=1 Tax=Enterococcus sp. LJL51 TaxID=3416656 RepID=UPI003CF1D5C8